MNKAGKRALLNEIHDISADGLIRWARVETYVHDWRATGLTGGGGGPKAKNEVSDPTFRAATSVDVVMKRHSDALGQLGVASTALYGPQAGWGAQFGYLLRVSANEANAARFGGQALSVAQGAMRAVDKHVRWCLDPQPEVVKHNVGLSKCVNAFGCPDDSWGCKAGRCVPCYEYLRRTGRDRSKAA